MESGRLFGMENEVHQGCVRTEETTIGMEYQGGSGHCLAKEQGGLSQEEKGTCEASILGNLGHDSERLSGQAGYRRSVDKENREWKAHVAPPSKDKKASAKDLHLILKEQGYMCAACGLGLEPHTSEIDHKQPRADGGNESPANLQWLCKPCNRAKGEMSMSAFIAMCVRVVHIHTKEHLS